MLGRLFRLIIFLTVVLQNSASFGSLACAKSAVLQQRFGAEKLYEIIPAVHAMNSIPQSGVLSIGGKQAAPFGVGVSRRSIHFALGELVRPHDGVIERASWEQMSYAVVTPLSNLKSQLVNLNTYDTFILGEFRIPADSVIVVPSGHEHLVPNGLKSFTYDQSKSNLRSAVDSVIQENGWLSFRMKDNYDGKFGSALSYTASAMWGESNVNTKDFFAPLLNENPRLSFGTHIRSQVGDAWRFGKIEQDLSLLLMALTSYTKQEVILHRNLIRFELQKVVQSYADSVPPQVMREISALKADVESWLRLIDLEIFSREKRGVSLSLILDEFAPNRNEPAVLKEKLRTVLRERESDLIHASLFNSVFTFKGEKFWKSILDSIPPEERRQFFEDNISLITEDSGLSQLSNLFQAP